MPAPLGASPSSGGEEVKGSVVKRWLCAGLPVALCCALLLTCTVVTADPPEARPRPSIPNEERPSPHYASIRYADIVPTLTTLAQASPRLRLEQLARSAGGLPLVLVTVSSAENLARLDAIRAQRQDMVQASAADASTAEAEAFSDGTADNRLPIIVLLNVGWQGNLYAGVDAALAVIHHLATDASAPTQRILENVVLLVNVVPNPDGRVSGSPGNATDLLLASDLVPQTQPETRAVIALLSAWNPMVVLDVEAFGSPMAIRPSAPPTHPPVGISIAPGRLTSLMPWPPRCIPTAGTPRMR